jgi:hypothetical protein
MMVKRCANLYAGQWQIPPNMQPTYWRTDLQASIYGNVILNNVVNIFRPQVKNS